MAGNLSYWLITRAIGLLAAPSETTMGSLTAGRLADFVVPDRDIMVVPEAEILRATVPGTYIGGRAVYERSR